jgi:hypothetical protein
MNQRFLFIAVIAAALALVGFFVIERGLNAPQVRPVANARIAKEQTTVLTESRSSGEKSTPRTSDATEAAGTRANARASFLKFRRCHEDYATYQYLTQAVDQCYSSPGSKGNFVDCPKSMSKVQLAQNAEQNRLADCGRDYNKIDRAYYDTTVAAAKSGDTDAQMCYVQSRFADEAVGSQPFYTDGDKNTYKATAPQYISDAFTRGDWRVVQILSVNSVGPGSGLFYLVPGAGNPDMFYKINRLLRLGAEGQYARVLDFEVKDLPPDKLAAAEAWATAMYSQHFSASPKLTQAPVPCPSSVEGGESVKEIAASGQQ